MSVVKRRNNEGLKERGGYLEEKKQKKLERNNCELKYRSKFVESGDGWKNRLTTECKFHLFGLHLILRDWNGSKRIFTIYDASAEGKSPRRQNTLALQL